MTLATFAIALKILIPPGFMTGVPTNDTPFALVLCTGQGAMVVHPGDALPGRGDHDSAPAGSSHDSPCVFSGHALGAPPPSLVDAVVVEFVAYAYRPQAAVTDLAPGRGLTGPPLPARGPPALLI
jgi:hypothetical protein